MRAAMTDDPIALDDHRGTAARKATEIRRRLAEVEADQAELRRRQSELEKFLVAAPATTWREAGEKARYLIMLLAATPAALDPRHQTLIAGVLQDFQRLSTQPEPRSAEPDTSNKPRHPKSKRGRRGLGALREGES
jgi:hypothetical protein